MNEKNTVIELNNVSKSFKGKVVLHHISQRFEQGKIIGILGENGCGKSVLFKCISGLMDTDAGEIVVDGNRVSTRQRHHGEIGVMIEMPALIDRFSGIRNLLMISCICGKLKKQQVAQVMREVGLDPQLRIPVSQYSLGMKQKLALAQAIMERPKVLLLDEPFNALDAESVTHVQTLLRTLNQQGTTILMTSHHPEDIANMCSVSYCLSGGTLSKLN